MILDVRSSEYRANPYPFFRRLRTEMPICRTEPYGNWVLARYADVLSVLKDHKLFSSAGIGPEPSWGPQFILESRGLVGMDPPDHTRLRRLAHLSFAPKNIKWMEEEIRHTVRGFIRKMQERDEIEMISEFASPVPMCILTKLLGMEEEMHSLCTKWVHTLLTWRNTKFILDPVEREIRDREVSENSKAMFEYLCGLLEKRIREPRKDLISTLILARDGDKELSFEDLLAFIRLLLVAGSEASTNLIGNSVVALLDRPELFQQIRNQPALIPNMIEESLRFDSPVIGLMREAREDCEISGVKISKGELVLPLLASANHDENVFENPGSFDIYRSNASAHLSLGSGVHFCLGSFLAKMQARITFEEFFASFGGIQRTDDDPLPYLDSFFFRGVKKLKVHLTVIS